MGFCVFKFPCFWVAFQMRFMYNTTQTQIIALKGQRNREDKLMSKHITGHTGLLCLLGSPVAHSVSPEMHNEACDQLGLDYTYLAFDVPEEKMPQAVEGLRTMGARGWNITMPGKNIMCKLADKVSPASEISGACNTIGRISCQNAIIVHDRIACARNFRGR